MREPGPTRACFAHFAQLRVLSDGRGGRVVPAALHLGAASHAVRSGSYPAWPGAGWRRTSLPAAWLLARPVAARAWLRRAGHKARPGPGDGWARAIAPGQWGTLDPRPALARRWEVDCPDNMVNVRDLQQLQQLVEDSNAAGRLAVVQFFASDCYACKSMQPKMRQIARDHGEVLFIKLNGAASEELGKYCEDMQIDRIPYFHFYQV